MCRWIDEFKDKDVCDFYEQGQNREPKRSMRVNFDQNWYAVMRQIISNAKNGEYKTQSSVNKDGKQYWIEAEYTIKELHFEDENIFIPMS